MEAEALKAEGNKLVGEGNWPEAAKMYKKAIKIDPSRAAYYSNLALCYEKMEDVVSFEETAQKCIEIDPSFVKGYYRLAKAQYWLWEYEQARETLQRGLELDKYNPDMLQMKKIIMESIQELEGANSSLLSVSDENLPFLGGLPEGCECKIPQNSSYARIPRTPLPPLSKKHKDLTLFSRKCRPIIESFFNGALKIKWSYNRSYDLCGAITEELFVVGILPTDQMPILRLGLSMEGEENDSRRPFKHLTHLNSRYHYIIPNDTKACLLLVMMERFLRENCLQLMKLSDEYFVHRLFNFLAVECYSKGLYKDCVDLRITLADTCVNHGSVYTVSYDNRPRPKAIVQLAEAMEAAKQFREAANVYIDLTDEHIFERPPNAPLRQTHSFAALALKRSKEFVMAEWHYVSSLKCPNWHWTTDEEDQDCTFLRNMLVFYSDVDNSMLCGELLDSKEHRLIQKAGVVFAGLLTVAGYRMKDNCFLHRKESRPCQAALKQKYLSPKKALQCIRDAILSSNIGEYHESLYKCQRSNTKFKYTGIGVDMKMHEDDWWNAKKEKAKNDARDVMMQDFELQSISPFCTKIPCYMCHEHAPNYMECPCRSVRYCSKQCQVTHWPTHKRVCPTKKKKK